MANKTAPFRQADITRAIRAATAAGQKPTRVDIMPNGAIIIAFAGAADVPISAPDTPTMDEWIGRRHARKAKGNQ